MGASNPSNRSRVAGRNTNLDPARRNNDSAPFLIEISNVVSTSEL
jgi:hypothetical protein